MAEPEEPGTEMASPSRMPRQRGREVDEAEDRFSLQIIKERMATFQEEEIRKGRQQLHTLRRTYDKLKVEVRERIAHLNAIEKVAEEAHSGTRAPKTGKNKENAQQIAGLETRIQGTVQEMEMAKFRSRVLDHMANRLKTDILAEKKKAAAVNRQLTMACTELKATQAQFMGAKQELRHQQQELQQLRGMFWEKQDTHKKKIDSVRRLLTEQKELVREQMDLIRHRDQVVEQAAGDVQQDEAEKINRVEFVRNMYGVLLEKQHAADEEQLGTLEEQFQMLKNVTGLDSVDDVISKFQDREKMNGLLVGFADGVRKRIEELRKYNETTMRAMGDLKAKTDAESRNRETYQELDLIDSALATARRQCADSSERAVRMHVILNEVQSFVTRLLERVSYSSVSTPSHEKVPEALSQLDSKLSQIIKAVHGALSTDDDDPANAIDANPQALRRKNLMDTHFGPQIQESLHGTPPDLVQNNVRVQSRVGRGSEMQRIQNALLLGDEYDDLEDKAAREDGGYQVPTMKELMTNFGHKEDNLEEFIVDRDTIKRVCDLIVARETLARVPKKQIIDFSDSDSSD
eukprot:scaffold2314_cov267-Pinguiococcus_pyrenoidosus.AAC.4